VTAARGLADRRDPVVRAWDHTDARLTDLFHALGLLTADDQAGFTRDDVLKLARAAYWRGVVDHQRFPDELARIGGDADAHARAQR
jgi:hypothetical protein